MSDLKQPDLIPNQSQRDYYHLIHELTRLLPPPLVNTPQGLLDRNQEAVDEVAGMLPVNANEARLATLCIGARAQADDVLRQLREYNGDDLKIGMKLNALYGLLVRTSLAAHGHLLRAQALRHKREGVAGAASADEWTQYIAARKMQRVLESDVAGAVPDIMSDIAPTLLDPLDIQTPTPAAEFAPAAPLQLQVQTAEPLRAEPLPPAEQPMPAASQPPAPVPEAAAPRFRDECITVADEQPPRDVAAEAERYAVVYPRRAQPIRQYGGLPPDCDFGPPDDELVHAIVTGTGPALRELDSAVHA